MQKPITNNNEGELGLPSGWSERYDTMGNRYYVDKINKRATWVHPRKHSKPTASTTSNKPSASQQTANPQQGMSWTE